MVVGELTEQSDVLVIGGGPGGYVAAFRAADLGLETTLVDEHARLGGVCLRVGCIPSKALLHVAHLITEAEHAKDFGISFGKPKIDAKKLHGWKESVVERLCGGVRQLAKGRKINVIQARATFEDSRTVRLEGEKTSRVRFGHCILASGSRVKALPEKVIPADCCIDSSGALEVEDIPKSLLVVGGGYIGLELGQVYAALGSEVTVIEMLDRVLVGADEDIARPLLSRLKKQFKDIHVGAKLESAKKKAKQVEVTYTKNGQQHTETYDKVLVSVGRRPNSDHVGLENTKVTIDRDGFVEVDEQRRTADKRIFAIGDVAGNPMLAHKASREGIVAAEAIAGRPSAFDVRAIPAVVYTSPEVAWCGLTEAEARSQNRAIKVGKFNWAASGRAIAMGRPEGLTKIISDAETKRILGVGIVGEHAGDLISEAVLAMEMGAEAEDLALTIHPHPSISETVMEAAESVLGSAIHMLKK